MGRGRTLAVALAGPALIVAAVLAVLHDFAFGGMLSSQHVDTLAFWLPNHCYLGEGLAAGHIRSWNPHVMGGIPFAADPQSGWMYLPAMVLYTLLPCHDALAWFIVLQPLLAGLGVYAFLRGESVSRPAATAGGLVMALTIAGSATALSLPFSATLAWGALVLAAGSRYFRAPTWGKRFLWAGLTSAAWGQLAAAHFSNGLVLGTGLLAFYGVARTWSDVRAGVVSARRAVVAAALLLAALPLLNLAFLLPRLAYLSGTTLGLGYDRLLDLSAEMSGIRRIIRVGASANPSWILSLAASPGAYAGATALALSFAGLWGRFRRLSLTFGLFGVLCYALSLKDVADVLEPLMRAVPGGDFYLHNPGRFRFGVFLVLPLLVAFGVDAWREGGGARRRLAMVLPAVGLWGVMPVAEGFEALRLTLLAIGAMAAAAVLTTVAARPALALSIPALLAVELSANALVGQAAGREVPPKGTPNLIKQLAPFTNLLEPNVRGSDYTRESRLSGIIRAGPGRYVSVSPGDFDPYRAYLLTQDPADFGLLANQRSMLFGLEDVQGYNPAQNVRYWLYVRAVRASPIKYTTAAFIDPTPAALDLLQVRWIVAPAERPPDEGDVKVAEDGRWALYRRDGVPPRASVHTLWSVVPTGDDALRSITDPSFDAAAAPVVLEEDPGVPRVGLGGSGRATYRALGPQAARVTVEADAPSVVLVRNVWDARWRATVDGQQATVLRADYLLQAVAVPAGRHTILFTHDDPWVGYGLLGSALALATMIAGALIARRRDGPGPPAEQEHGTPRAHGQENSQQADAGAHRPSQHGHHQQA